MKDRVEDNNDKIFSTWIQKLEQNIKSIEKRLDAVERRLSGESFKSTKFRYNVKEKEDISKDELSKIKEKIKIIEMKISELEKKEPVTISLKRNSSAKGNKEIHDFDKSISELKERLKKLESRETVVKIGKIEFPIEITGIVGGIIAIIIAIILLSGYKNIITTPSFVFAIGLILLISVAIKIYVVNKNVGKSQ